MNKTVFTDSISIVSFAPSLAFAVLTAYAPVRSVLNVSLLAKYDNMVPIYQPPSHITCLFTLCVTLSYTESDCKLLPPISIENRSKSFTNTSKTVLKLPHSFFHPENGPVSIRSPIVYTGKENYEAPTNDIHGCRWLRNPVQMIIFILRNREN